MDEYSESIRKKMQSIKADTDQIFATINKHEKDIKDANTISKKERSILDLQEDASTLRVVIASSIILINSISCGVAVAFSATIAVGYGKGGSETNLSKPLMEEEISWLTSVIQIAIMVSTLSSGLVSDNLGRKKALIIGQMLILFGWSLLYFAWNFQTLLTARCVMGIGVGIAYPNICMYLSEISLIRNRGTLSVINTIMTNAAFIYSLLFSAILSLKGLILASALIPILFLMVAYFLPESPLWLVKKKNYEKFEETMHALRGSDYQPQAELHDIQSVCNSTSTGGFISTIMNMKCKEVWIPVSMMLAMFILQPMSGSDILVFYSLAIFKRANVNMNSHVLAIFVQSGFLFGYIIAAFLMSRVTRKAQFIISGIFMATFLFALGFILKSNTESIENDFIRDFVDALMPICVILTGFAFALGVGPVLFALLGEILPQRIKSLACAVILSAKNLMTFLNLKIFPSGVNLIGLHYMFWIHSAICVGTCVLAAFVLPDTQGKSLEELSNLYQKKPSPVERVFMGAKSAPVNSNRTKLPEVGF